MSTGQAGDLSAFFAPQGGAFDTSSVVPLEDFLPLTPGDYPVQIEAAEIKRTKAGDGNFIELRLCVLDGPANGRKLWDRLNIDNPSAKAVEISMRSLAAIGQATGLAVVRDTQELVGKMCLAAVKVSAKNGDNEIRTYKPFDAVAPAAPAAPVAPIAPAPAVYTPAATAAHQAAYTPAALAAQAPAAPVAPVAPAAPAPAAPVAPFAPAPAVGVAPWKTNAAVPPETF